MFVQCGREAQRAANRSSRQWQEELTCTLAFTRFKTTRSWPVAVSRTPCNADRRKLVECLAAELATQCNLQLDLFFTTSAQ
jgi:hypothetical protein